MNSLGNHVDLVEIDENWKKKNIFNTFHIERVLVCSCRYLKNYFADPKIFPGKRRQTSSASILCNGVELDMATMKNESTKRIKTKWRHFHQSKWRNIKHKVLIEMSNALKFISTTKRRKKASAPEKNHKKNENETGW